MHAKDRVVARERERFLSTGSSRDGVREEILSSWTRSTRSAVDPESTEPSYAPDAGLESRLTRAASAVLDTIDEKLGDLGVGFILTDADARILDVQVRDRALLGELERIRAVPGFDFSEGAVGTTGLGTPIELGRMIRVDGHEHFGSRFVRYTCVGVPIHDPLDRRRPVGVLDVTCKTDPDNRLINLVAAQTARSVETRLYEQYSAAERVLLDRFMSASRHRQVGIVVVGRRILLKNPRAARLLDGIEHALVRDHAATAMASSMSEMRGEITLDGGGVAVTRTTPVREAGETLGVLIELRPQPAAKTHRGASPAPVQLPSSLVGEDLAIVAGFRAGRAAVDRRLVIVTGESGVGKLALGRAMLDDAGTARILDAGEVPRRHEADWAARLAGSVEQDHTPVIVRRLDRLSVTGRDDVLELLRSAVGRGLRCVATLTGRGLEADRLLASLDVEIVRIPPLRHRMGDLPALVAAFAGSARVSPQVIELLLRLPWSGNVSALRATVTRMTATVPDGGVVGPGHVPAEILRAAPRRTLSRFELAEIHAICDALVEVDGNKRDAAALLGISRSTLYRKMQAGGLDLDNVM